MYIEEQVKSNTALNCGSFCECTGLKNNTCLLGPDENGHFITRVNVSSEEVDSCNLSWCTCDTHADVMLLLADGQTTFNEIIATRAAVGNIIIDERVFIEPTETKTPDLPVLPEETETIEEQETTPQ